jgi:YD repeat-containing protein
MVQALGLLMLVVALSANAQYDGYHFIWPYLNSQPSKAAVGATPAEACAQRTDAEILQTINPATPILFVGLLPSGQCGFQWYNATRDEVTDFPKVTPAFATCAQFNAMVPEYPRPAICSLECPADQKDATGLCRVSTPKNPGPPCPRCANPVHPGTGNKFQAESDLAPVAGGQIRLVRYYNSGRPAFDKVFGGFWRHSYHRRILISAPPTLATYYRNDGKEFRFTLQDSSWITDADVSDALTEFKDAQGQRTGWTVRVAGTDDTEHYDASGKLIAIERRSGLTETLTYADGTDGSASGNGGFVLDAAGNPTAELLPKGLLLRIRDHFGRSLTLGYDSLWRIVKIADPAGGTYLYTYAPAGNGFSNLVSVEYPDGQVRQYHYNEPTHTSGTSKPNALTGITDENGARFASYKYDSFGRAIESLHHTAGGDVDRHQLSYGVSGVQTTVIDPLGTTRTYDFQTTLGVVKNTALSQPGDDALGAALAYDANGNMASRTDFNGNRTDYTYDLARNLETSRTEGLTSTGTATPQTRTINTQWDAVFRLPTGIAEPLRITTNVYDPDGTQCGARGAMCSRTIQATTDANGSQAFGATATGTPRTWSYTYNANGSMLTMDGPRTDVTDVTTYTYYSNSDPDLGKRGNLASVTNASGHVTSITAYNVHGQPLTIVDANALTTTLVYDARLRLTSRTVGSETTSYDYDGVGQLIKITLPDGSFLSYSYDAAHRMTGMQDNLGNRIAYTLDAMGNRTQEQVFDPGNNLAQTRSRVFNNLNRLFQDLGAAAQVTEYAYDNQGNVTSVKDPLNKVTANAYDALNRLRQVTDPALGVTQYAYNGLDALTQVTDPRNLVTGYTVDGLGNLTLQQSPDTGNTVNTYDPAGNLLTQTDAKGQTTSYAYDVLSRVTLITFHDGSKQTYAYDQGMNGLGRLSTITETDPGNAVTSVIAYAYDAHGRVTSETRTLGAIAYVTAYSYDSFGRMSTVTYPSGRTVTYAFDALGRVSQVTTTKPGESPQIVVQNVSYHPFGGVTGYTFGNGQVYSRSVDQDGRIASYTLGAQSYGIGYDAASRIEFISETGNPPNTNTYGYDALDRLTSAALPSSTYGYGYDAVGNRLTKSTGGASDVYAYSPTNNRLVSITPTSGPVRSFTFDPNGSTTADGNNTYAYDVRGRMVQAVSSLGTTTYQVNALGQRIRKTNSLGDRVFHYDTRGKLIAESDSGGAVKRELLYLGDIPVGVVQ